MNIACRLGAAVLLLALTAAAAGSATDDAGAPALSDEQIAASGIQVAHPVPATAPQQISALGSILDPVALQSDAGELAAAQAAERTQTAEHARLKQLFEGGAGASLKMIEQAEAERIRAQIQRQTAEARFGLHWRALFSLAPTARRQLIADVAAGRTLLLRADVPGRKIWSELPASARLDVEGVTIDARVIGVLPQTSDVQSAGLLIEVGHPPRGLGPGAIVPVILIGREQSGLRVSADAVLHAGNGPFVYKRLPRDPASRATHFAVVPVTVLEGQGRDRLLQGVNPADDIVVRGAGVLWSLQGVGNAADSDDD